MTHMGSDSPAVYHSPVCWTEMSSGLLSASLQAHEDSQESLTSLPRRDTMGSYLPDSSSYDLLTVIGMEMKTRVHVLASLSSWWDAIVQTEVKFLMDICVSGRGLDDLMTVNLARYRPTGEHVAIRRIDLESCTNDMVNFLQVRALSADSHSVLLLCTFLILTAQSWWKVHFHRSVSSWHNGV